MASRHRLNSNERRPQDNDHRGRKSPVRELIASPRRSHRPSSRSRYTPDRSQRRSRSARPERNRRRSRTRSPPPTRRSPSIDRAYPKSRRARSPYQPAARGRDPSESPRRHSSRSRRRSRSPVRRRSRGVSPARSSRRDERRSRHSPRRSSPDHYIPRDRRRSRSPIVDVHKTKRRSDRSRSRERFSERRRSRDSRHERRSHSPRGRSRDHHSSLLRRKSRSTSPRRRHPEDRGPSKSRNHRSRRRSPSEGSADDSMRPYQHPRGGSSRGARPPGSAATHYPEHGTYYTGTPQAFSPQGRTDWVTHPLYPGSHQGSPLYQMQNHRLPAYPTQQSPPYFPPTATHYKAPTQPDPRSQTSPWRGGFTPPDRRQSNSSTERYPQSREAPARGGRGHFTNLSWTPATGSRGGIQVPARSRATSQQKSGDGPEGGEDNDDDGDDLFRPSKDLQVEDQSTEAPKPETLPKTTANGDTKFRFTLKSKVTATNVGAALDSGELKPNPLSAKSRVSDTKNPLTNPKQPQTTNVKVAQQPRTHTQDSKVSKTIVVPAKPVKKVQPRPTLPPELAASDSVYYRKPGNESVVGSGTYGKVFRAVHVYTGNKVALKKIRMEGERDGFPVTAIREVKLLQSLRHENIVELQEVMVEKNDCYMVFEYLSHDLTGLLNHPTFQLDDGYKKDLARQLFEGLDYLHRRGVLHRDIKAANILISNTGQLKLADFGLARFYAKRRQLDYTNRVITIWYRSPELLLGETQYGAAVDIWSAACVLVEIFTKHAIFPGDGGEINQLDRIYSVLGTPTRAEWPEVVDMAWFELLRPTERRQSTFAEKYRDRVTPQAFELLSAMFLYNPQKRPTAVQVLEHPFFTDEEPRARPASELKGLEGDWHEFESKALRKEKERVDREARKLQATKRPDPEHTSGRDVEPDHSLDAEREVKRPKLSPGSQLQI